MAGSGSLLSLESWLVEQPVNSVARGLRTSITDLATVERWAEDFLDCGDETWAIEDGVDQPAAIVEFAEMMGSRRDLVPRSAPLGW